jgi:hypothetical protein
VAPLDFNAPAPEEQAEIRRRKGGITRRIKQEVLTKYGLDRLPKRGERHLVRGGQGTGKSTVTAEQIAQLCGETVIWWMVPTLEKAEQQAQEYAALASADSMRARVVRGRGAPDSRNPNEAMCPRHAVVNRAARMGVNVQSEICDGGCPLRFTCGFQRQLTMREDPVGLFMMAADYLWLPCPAPRPDFIIADESVIAKATETISFDPARILEDSKWAIPKDLDRAMYLRGTATLVRAAVTEHPRRELAFLCDMSVTDEPLKDCADHLRMKGEAKPAVNGAMPDKVISDILDAVEAREILKVFRLFAQIRLELPQPRDRLNSVWFEPDCLVKVDGELERVPRVFVSYVRRPYRLRKETPVLCLDGTGSLSLNRKIFGDHMTAERFAVLRDAKVYQVSSKTFSRQSITGTKCTSIPAAKPCWSNPRGRDGPGDRPRATNLQPPEGVRAEQPAFGSDDRSRHDMAGASPQQVREGVCSAWCPATFTGRSYPLFSRPVEVRGRCKRGPEVVAKNRGRIANRYIIWRNSPVFFGGAEGVLSTQRSARTGSLRTGLLRPAPPASGAGGHGRRAGRVPSRTPA